MIRIGVLSDTHSFLDPKLFHYFAECDEIWHGGDIGDIEIIDRLQEFKPSYFVYGNIDDQMVRRTVPEVQIIEREQHKILMIHIAGPFQSYNKKLKELIEFHKPTILVCGHSHILKVAYDHKFELLYLNPGACGNRGFHPKRTLLRFSIDGSQIKGMEVIELGERGKIQS